MKRWPWMLIGIWAFAVLGLWAITDIIEQREKHEHERLERFMAACIKDYPWYRCDILYRSGKL